MSQVPEPFTSVTNDQLYDTWASTYDTDGNVLQAVDDLELEVLLPEFVKLTCSTAAGRDHGAPLRILDFGCGTGRNTIKLLQAGWERPTRRVDVSGWDGSQAMLDIAKQKASTLSNDSNVQLAGFQQMDFSDPSVVPAGFRAAFDGVVSTLVLEHLPLDTFFSTLTALLRPGAVAVVTNMHPEMGARTKAGYKTASGERVKGESYVHGVEESVRAAEAAGLQIVGEVRERAIDEGMKEKGEVGERGKKWLGIRVWYGFIVRKKSEA